MASIKNNKKIIDISNFPSKHSDYQIKSWEITSEPIIDNEAPLSQFIVIKKPGPFVRLEVTLEHKVSGTEVRLHLTKHVESGEITLDDVR